MLNKKLAVLALGVMAATQAMASEQADSKGFVEDSHLDVLLRNAYISRDYKHGGQDKAEWGQGVIAKFNSGFTQGTVGVGVDAFGLYALRLDGGTGRAGAGGIDFFKRGGTSDDPSSAPHDLARAGAAVKVRISNTVIKYGDQMPALPVLNFDDSRLLPESFTGTLITSKEINGLVLNAGRFTQEARKSAEARDSGGLKKIDVYGGSYQFSDSLTGALYASDVEDRLKKQYVNLNYVLALPSEQSLTFDFNGYRSHLDKDYASTLGTGQDNKIWSLAATWAFGPHSLTLAHQRSTGDTGYNYGFYQNAGGVGDGGSTIFLANSYWSDFNAEDEVSWQLGYGIDFRTFGVPGLTYKVAYVRGDNIRTPTGDGQEREIFNQVQYVVQNGPAKDLTLRLRGSWLRTSDNVRASGYNDDGNEVRAFVEYPINIF
ncbi:OprD family porin [Pseudomonas sp. CFBP 8771]|uniref:OprD family porin n=1 Tax=Pseudomonas sp. CFBP 8771 TaxID=2775285 RepID=UPI00177C54C4|nr:OprD family porin [Pseudomonas sp. CFBP 8771]MBD8604187.1 OprD family porin [Pseudomonas sp. CFBP 8771]